MTINKINKTSPKMKMGMISSKILVKTIVSKITLAQVQTQVGHTSTTACVQITRPHPQVPLYFQGGK